MSETMLGCVFKGPGEIALEEVRRPKAGPGQAVIRTTLTTICATDIHIVKGELPVEKLNLVVGHEVVGVLEEAGPGVDGEFQPGDRVITSCLTPCGVCRFCQMGLSSHCGGFLQSFWFSNKIHGCQAEYVLVPHARFNLCKIPDALSDEQVLFATDIMSTGFAACERAHVKGGDTVAVFAQGPVGLCATTGARLFGAALVIAIDTIPERLEMAKRMGADVVLDYRQCDPVAEIRKLTGGGVDVAIEALGSQATFEAALRSLRVGGTLSSVGVYPSNLTIPVDAFGFGVGNHTIVTTVCPSGRQRLERLMDLVQNGKVDLTSLITHRVKLGGIVDAYRQFQERTGGVIKFAIRP